MTQNPTTTTEAGAVADVAAKLTEARAMRMEWSTDAGPVVFRFPSNLSARDVEDVSELLALTVAAMQRRAAHLTSQGATASDREPVEREG
jgi:hypothetical protein